ncbi:hypothetical protein SUGI_1034570 [Cryptomeria japonica]|nr:hypothetical protein SUGI_1034570 [Cryptomeria japonica]
MPTLNLSTNVPVDGVVSSDILKDCSKTVARVIGKPESYVMVLLKGGVPISFGVQPLQTSSSPSSPSTSQGFISSFMTCRDPTLVSEALHFRGIVLRIPENLKLEVQQG